MYITEIAPLRVRGSFGACFQLFVAMAVMLAQLLGLDILLGRPDLWNYLFGLFDNDHEKRICSAIVIVSGK